VSVNALQFNIQTIPAKGDAGLFHVFCAFAKASPLYFKYNCWNNHIVKVIINSMCILLAEDFNKGKKASSF
jgi:hypothetical protein